MTMENAVIAGYPIILPDFRAAFHRERPDWHKPWLDSIHESLKPDDVVIDVGAEQGDLSALVASWVPDGGIVLVEPQPLFWPTIRATFEANGLKPLATIEGYLSELSNGLVTIYADGWPSSSQANPMSDPGFYHLNEIPAPTLALDHAVHDWDNPARLPAPTALIIDVEGAELHTLHGCEMYLSESQPLVWCAIHPEIMRDRYGHDPNELLAYMYRLGYRWDLLAFQGEIHVKFTPR